MRLDVDAVADVLRQAALAEVLLARAGAAPARSYTAAITGIKELGGGIIDPYPLTAAVVDHR